MDDTLVKFEKSYEKFYNLQNKHRNKRNRKITLILGTTGTGKTTLAKFLFTDNKKLKSVDMFGEFIIQDDETEISHEISSKTIEPKLYYDEDSLYFDCPGFSDNRSPLTDVIGASFIKQIIAKNDSIRLMITINYASMKIGVDKISFLSTIKHLIEFVKNIEIMKDNIILVITKVDKCNEMEASNDMLYDEIECFLSGVKKFLIEQISNSSDQGNVVFAQQLKLVEILKNNENIIFFKRPKQCGTLHDVKLLQKDKNDIKQILSKVQFTVINKTDLGFAISDNSKIYIINLLQKIVDKIISHVNIIAENIITYYQNEIKMSKNISQAKHLLDIHYQELSILIDNLNTSTTYSNIMFHIMKYLNKVFLENHSLISATLLKYKCITLLESIYNGKFEIKSAIWTKKFKDILCEIEKLQFGLRFLINFYEKLHYDIFKSIQNLKADTSDEIKIILSKVESFVLNFNNISNIIMKNDCLKTIFQDIINEISDDDIQINDKKLIAKGNYICLSKIIDFMNEHQHNNIEEINIYALNTFFIDVDFSKRKLLKMVIISPKWIVVDRRNIDLRGNRGEAHSEIDATQEHHGKPGFPGEPGCAFMGVTKLIINASNLHIDTSGGDGGPGQNGGSGFPGKDGTVELPNKQSTLENGLHKIKHLSEHVTSSSTKNFLWYLIGCSNSLDKKKYVVNSANGTAGGDGYMGGKGGYGGYSGEFLFTIEDNVIRTMKNDGKNGDDGKPGEGGLGGINSPTYILDYEEKNFHFFFIHVSNTDNKWSHSEIRRSKTAASGKTNPNKNEKGQNQPQEKNIINNPWSYIIDYKKYLLNNISRINFDQSTDFFIYLSENIKFENKYQNIKNIIDDFSNLEEYSLKNRNIDMLYKTFASTAINNMENSENQNILFLLYIVALSKLSCFHYKKPKNCSLIDSNCLQQAKDIIEKTSLLYNLIEDNNKIEENRRRNNFSSYFINNMEKKNNDLKDYYHKYSITKIESKQWITDNDNEKFKKILKMKTYYTSELISFLLTFNEFLTNCMININDVKIDEIFSQELESTDNVENKENTSIFKKAKSICKGIKNAFIHDNPEKSPINVLKLQNTCDESKKCFVEFSNDQTYIIKSISNHEINLITELMSLVSKLNDFYKNDQKECVSFELKDINKILVKMKESINDLFFHLENKEYFLTEMNILSYEIDILINIYDQFEYFKEQKILYDNLSYMSNMIKENIPGECPEKQICNKILNNIVLDQYYKSIDYFKDISFPFGTFAPFQKMKNESDFVSLRDDVLLRIEEILKIIQDGKMEFLNFDTNNCIIKRSFKDVKNGDVFYTWYSDKYKHIIKDLLLGKQISIKSNILNCIDNVVKFNTIGINLHSFDEKINSQLKDLLNECTVTMEHMGNSYYKLNDKYYIVVMNKTTFKYKFREESHQVSSLPILSPYATFNIKLEKTNTDFQISEDIIETIYDKIDLHLIGEGQYFDSNFIHLLNVNEMNCIYNQDDTLIMLCNDNCD